jgi:hypothetical protein
MNSSQSNPKNNLRLSAGLVGVGLAALVVVAASGALAAGKSKGVDVEIPYEATVLKTSSLVAPEYLNPSHGGMVVSDAAGGVYLVTMAGKTTELAAKSKLKHPAGVAVAPTGFGVPGQVFVLSSGDDANGACEVDAIDKSGGITTFAKLPDGGGGKPTQCRDLEFGAAATAYAGRLYAATAGNSVIYAIDASGKAAVFGAFDKPLAFDLTGIGFALANDPKAPNMMLVGMRPKMGGAAKIGRIGVVGPDGKLKDDPYLVGFIRPTGFGTSPANWGSYGDTFFIADFGRPASDSAGVADGSLYRLYKGVARPFASRLADPTSMKFIGSRLVIADPAIKGSPGSGGIVVISSML